MAALKRAVKHGHLPHLTPEVLRRFSLNGVFAAKLVDALRESLHTSDRPAGVHSVHVSHSQIVAIDEKLAAMELFEYTPKRKLLSTDAKSPPAVDLEAKALDAAIHWYVKFLAGERAFDEEETSVFTDEHNVENDLLPDE